MNKYEGLFILDPAVKEEALKLAIDKIQDAIKHAGGRVANVQKLDQRPFARITSKRQSGFYVNMVFDAPPKAITELNARFHLETGMIRWQFTMYKEPDPRVRQRPAMTETTSGRDRDYRDYRD